MNLWIDARLGTSFVTVSILKLKRLIQWILR